MFFKGTKKELSLFIVFSALAFSFFCFLGIARAETLCDSCPSDGAVSGNFTCTNGRWQGCPDNAIVCNPLNACSFQDLIDKLISLVTIIAIALVPLMFVWAGMNFVTANGEPEKIKKAKNIMLYTVIGLGIVLLSRAIISAVKGILGTP